MGKINGCRFNQDRSNSRDGCWGGLLSHSPSGVGGGRRRGGGTRQESYLIWTWLPDCEGWRPCKGTSGFIMESARTVRINRAAPRVGALEHRPITSMWTVPAVPAREGCHLSCRHPLRNRLLTSKSFTNKWLTLAPGTFPYTVIKAVTDCKRRCALHFASPCMNWNSLRSAFITQLGTKKSTTKLQLRPLCKASWSITLLTGRGLRHKHFLKSSSCDITRLMLSGEHYRNYGVVVDWEKWISSSHMLVIL